MISGDEEGLDEGTTGKLTCNVTSAKPKPMLSWMKEGVYPPDWRKNHYQHKFSFHCQSILQNLKPYFTWLSYFHSCIDEYKYIVDRYAELIELGWISLFISGQRGYLISSESSDPNLITNSDGTYSTYLDLDISVTRSLIGSVYVCDVILDGVTNWNMSRRHQVDVNSKL